MKPASVERRLIGDPRILIARPARRIRPAVYRLPRCRRAVDVLQDVNLANHRPVPVVASVRRTQHPKCRPDAKLLAGGEVTELDPGLDSDRLAGRTDDISSCDSLNSGGCPGARDWILDWCDLECSRSGDDDVVGGGGVGLDFAGAPVSWTPGVGCAQVKGPFGGRRKGTGPVQGEVVDEKRLLEALGEVDVIPGSVTPFLDWCCCSLHAAEESKTRGQDDTKRAHFEGLDARQGRRAGSRENARREDWVEAGKHNTTTASRLVLTEPRKGRR